MELLPFTGYFISGMTYFVLGLLYLRSRFMLTEFLAGEWHGTLVQRGRPGEVLECKVIFAKHSGRSNSGLLYYWQRDHLGPRDIMNGLDEMLSVTSRARPTNFWKVQEWQARFIRRLHHDHTVTDQATVTTANGHSGTPNHYDWSGEIIRRFRHPAIKVTITGQAEPQLVFEGEFERH